MALFIAQVAGPDATNASSDSTYSVRPPLLIVEASHSCHCGQAHHEEP
jgi:hypothetical protein